MDECCYHFHFMGVLLTFACSHWGAKDDLIGPPLFFPAPCRCSGPLGAGRDGVLRAVKRISHRHEVAKAAVVFIAWLNPVSLYTPKYLASL